MNLYLIIFCMLIGLAIGIALLCFAFANQMQSRLRRIEQEQAIQQFRMQRELLEARFFDMASRIGKPRDLLWCECDWQDEVRFAEDKQSGLVTAFVSVNIHFEAVEGGDMEDVEAVGSIRDAVALFHFQNGCWGTGGRALFNMNPDDALVRLENQYAPLV